MKITPNPNLLLIKKHIRTALSVDISVAESDEDKRLITGEVLKSQCPDYPVGATVIFGKYALLKLTIKSIDYYFLEIEDVVGSCAYKEDETKKTKS